MIFYQQTKANRDRIRNSNDGVCDSACDAAKIEEYFDSEVWPLHS